MHTFAKDDKTEISQYSTVVLTVVREMYRK